MDTKTVPYLAGVLLRGGKLSVAVTKMPSLNVLRSRSISCLPLT